MATVHFTTSEKFEAKIRQLAADNNITLKETARQVITASGAVIAGTYKLGYNGSWTGNLNYNANAGTVQTALVGLFASGDVLCYGGPLPEDDILVVWGGNEQYSELPLLEIDVMSLIGGEYIVNSTSWGRGERLDMRLEQAYDAIEGALLARGLNAVEISSWARGEEFQLDIATYWYGRDNGWGGRKDDERDWLTVFNRVKELSEVPIVSDSGVLLSGSKLAVAEGVDLININANKGIYP